MNVTKWNGNLKNRVDGVSCVASIVFLKLKKNVKKKFLLCLKHFFFCFRSGSCGKLKYFVKLLTRSVNTFSYISILLNCFKKWLKFWKESRKFRRYRIWFPSNFLAPPSSPMTVNKNLRQLSSDPNPLSKSQYSAEIYCFVPVF